MTQTNTELQQQLHTGGAAQVSAKRGELYVQGESGFCCFGGGGWHTRFVVITIKNEVKKLKVYEQKAHYYARGKKQPLYASEILDCVNSKDSHNHTNGCGFIIHGKNKQTFHLSADFPQETQNWMQFIVCVFTFCFLILIAFFLFLYLFFFFLIFVFLVIYFLIYCYVLLFFIFVFVFLVFVFIVFVFLALFLFIIVI